MRRRDPLDDSKGFTLIELSIVILILAILVGIAVAVMFIAKKKAANATALSNSHIGEKCLDNAWFRCMEGIYAYYRDSNSTQLGAGANQYVYARYMSFMEPKIHWIDVTVAANVFTIYQPSAAYGWFKNRGGRTAVANITDMTILQGKIALTPCRPTNASGTTWAAANQYYRTVLSVDTVAHRAYFTCYYQGKITRSGSFTMNDNGTIAP
ncbi:MAG: type II secretion system protein [Candidatus Geothermincolia bacterium]